MGKLLKYDWSDESVRWSEADIQSAIVRELRQHGVAFEIGLEGVELSAPQARKAKVQGMEPGRCDMRLVLNMGRTLHIELKKATTGKLSDSQKDWHETLKRLGHIVHVVWARSPQDGIDQVLDLYNQYYTH